MIWLSMEYMKLHKLIFEMIHEIIQTYFDIKKRLHLVLTYLRNDLIKYAI